MASEIARSPAQVLLGWALQKGLVVLPKSTRADRLAENFAALEFTLPEPSMAALDALDEGLVTGWDPRSVP